MTAQTRQKFVELIASSLLTLLATLFVLFGTGAWSGKENTADHAADFRDLVEMQQRTLDVVCDGHAVQSPRAYRACTSPRPSPRVTP